MSTRSLDILINARDKSRPAFKSADSSLKSLARTAKITAVSIAAVFGVRQIARGISSIISSASQAEEAASKFGFVFGESAKKTQDALDQFAKQAGRSRFELREMAGDIGALIKPMGLTEEAAGDMSVQVAMLATDLASFFNSTDNEALVALRAGLVGESEPLRRFGVQLNADRVKTEALSLGLVKLGEKLTSAAKAQAIMNIVMKDTAGAQGDAIRTSSSFANQLKSLKAQFADLSVEVGTIFIPLATKVVGVLKSISKVNAEIAVKAVATAAAFSGTLLVLPKLVRLFKTITLALKAVAKGEALALSFGGPAGWAALAVSVAVAALAFTAIDSIFADTEDSASGAATEILTVTDAVDGYGRALQRAAQTRLRVQDDLKKILAGDESPLDVDLSGPKKTLGELTGQIAERARIAGRSPDEVLLERIRSLSGGTDTIAFITAKINLELAEARDKLAKMVKDGAALADSFKSPTQQFREDIEKLDEAFRKGKITAEEFKRAAEGLQAGIEADDKPDIGRPPAGPELVQGRFLTGLSRQNEGITLQRQIVQKTAETAEAAKESRDILRNVLERLQNGQPIIVGALS